MDNDILIAVLGTGGLTAIAGSIATGLFSRRKLGAEATEIITKAAAGVVTQMQGRIDEQEKERKRREDEHASALFAAQQQLASRENEHRLEIEEIRQTLQLHVAWDAIVRAKLGEANIEVPAPPPLLPPHRGYHLET